MVCVDANVLLEIILKRSHSSACSQFLLSDDDKSISVLSLDLVMYFVEKYKLPSEPIKKFLESFEWLPITDTDALWAFVHCHGKDFEDALQVSCAIREGCSAFATLDTGLYKKYADDIKIRLIR